ncbi:MAG: DUF368 domain-containing protein [Acidimicrobiia bacterium]|nr:DUF368 domain-containing protein [Acidimicrobiia bacterium]MYB09354.1 DUF368 domain-containing protein [Acidimicrobiia bacterium]MYG58284.1 DUF368 domain-containing protein [Acidimicrobiia bacterium]MYG72502.1 DUF368 domain-containing protein [Acidimicrobiia bacterium]MYJ34052.1 DUF368 domain-containing protein [Acidimicrobiia bacterium]
MWGRANETVRHAARGVLMGAADVVPGVSGGTVALLLGIYTRLIDTVRAGAGVVGTLLRGRWSEMGDRLRSFDWWFAVPLVAGIVVAVAALASVIDELLVDEPEAMAGLFFGLVAASVVVAWNLVDKPSAGLAVTALAVGGLFFWLLGLQSAPVADQTEIALFGSGIVAVCAMLLPGISGSFILLMMGVYPAAIAAVDDWVWGDLAALAAGAALGLALFSNVIGSVLNRWPDPTLAVMVGLLLGSLRVLWPWPAGVGVISRHAEEAIDGTGLGWAPAADLWLPAILAIAAASLVLVLAAMAAGQGGSARSRRGLRE